MTTAPTSTKARTQADRLLRHCVYRIATGKWIAGDRLPSIRTTRRQWGVNQLTVQEAYGRLVKMGLVESRPRSGYYVTGGGAFERLARYRSEMEALHRRVAELVDERSDLSRLGVLRYLAELEEIERSREPEVAFAECTETQAASHAREIAERLRIPVLPLTTAEIAGDGDRVPPQVRRLLTSGFHLDELRPLHRPPVLSVSLVPIEVSPRALDDIGEREVFLLEKDESMAAHIAEDANRLLGEERVRIRLATSPEGDIGRLLDTRPGTDGRVVLLSPRLWGSVDPSWRDDDRVREAAFRVTDGAWPQVADAAGLPLPVP